MNDGVQQHTQEEKMDEHIVYPHHPKRTVSALFARNHKILIDEMNLPCYKCYMKALGSEHIPAHAFKNRQVHHKLTEWATWNAIDGKKIEIALSSGYFDPYGFAKRMHGVAFTSPDDIRNLFVLCEEHHQSHQVGIHHTAEPEWTSDMFAKDGIDILLTTEEWQALHSGQMELDAEGRLVPTLEHISAQQEVAATQEPTKRKRNETPDAEGEQQ